MLRSHSAVSSSWGLFSLVLYYLLFVGVVAGLFTITTSEGSPRLDSSAPFLPGSHQSKASPPNYQGSNILKYDVVIYGSTPAALTAAVQVHAMGHSVAIVSPERHLGGLTASGLGWTDSKVGSAIGGIARDFYGEVYKHYLNTSTWTTESRQDYVKKNIRAQPGAAIEDEKRLQWTFEPHVAEAIFERWMAERGIPIYRGEYVVRTASGVSRSDGKINSFKTESGKTFTAKQFIDAGYEGDLMAAAGIDYVVGRDSDSLYNENLAGVRVNTGDTKGIGKEKAYEGVDPYIVKGEPSSGLLPGIELSYDALPANFTGSADNCRLQSYMYRLCLTRVKDNKVEFEKPSNYNESNYELLLRYYEAGHTDGFTTQLMPNKKTDSNSKGEVSFDFLGGNYDLHSDPPVSYTAASYERRREFAQAHVDWQKGVLWTLSHNERISAKLRSYFSAWGLAKDEFVSNNHWPYQLYIREARRMKGAYTLIQQDIQNDQGYLGGPIAGLGSYSMDSHSIRRVVLNGKIYDEGWFYMMVNKPYPIPLQAIFPKKSEATNFVNPVTISASHVAFGSARMEPTYMILGQSAGIAAAMAIDSGKAVQDVSTKDFMRNMKKYKQVTTV